MCKCGYTRDESSKCDGTHKVVKKVREDIANKIDQIEVAASLSSAVGIKMDAIKIARGE